MKDKNNPRLKIIKKVQFVLCVCHSVLFNAGGAKVKI